jgi:hypothetical protein
MPPQSTFTAKAVFGFSPAKIEKKGHFTQNFTNKIIFLTHDLWTL